MLTSYEKLQAFYRNKPCAPILLREFGYYSMDR